jgi:hypothetical protein
MTIWKEIILALYALTSWLFFIFAVLYIIYNIAYEFICFLIQNFWI